MNPAEWPPWCVMWAVAALLFILARLATWRAFARSGHRAVSLWRHVAYFVAWPGLDTRAFLTSCATRVPSRREWLFAAVKFAFGITLIFAAVPFIPTNLPMLRGWIGMLGIVFTLHFGIFHLLSCGWRAAGVEAKPLMNWPIAATSLADFWGRRWNTAFRDLTHSLLFRPLTRRLGPRVGLAAGFLFSGLVHDLVISLPAGAGYGWPTLYFVIQGLGLLAERSLKLSGFGNRLFAAAVLILPALALFHPPFVERVVLPFLDAILNVN